MNCISFIAILLPRFLRLSSFGQKLRPTLWQYMLIGIVDGSRQGTEFYLVGNFYKVIIVSITTGSKRIDFYLSPFIQFNGLQQFYNGGYEALIINDQHSGMLILEVAGYLAVYLLSGKQASA